MGRVLQEEIFAKLGQEERFYMEIPVLQVGVRPTIGGVLVD
jgi:hypothetical protein